MGVRAGRSGMKKIIIIVAAVLLLAGGGGAGWWFFLRDTTPPEPPPPVVSDPSAPATYTLLEPMTVSVIRGNEAGGRVSVQVAVEVRGEEAVALLKERRRTLIDAFYTELHGLLDQRFMAERNYDQALIKTRLRVAADRAMGPDVITDIIIKSVSAER